MKTVSRFEYAIMQELHKLGKLTDQEMKDVRPLSEAEELQKREDNLRSQASIIKINRNSTGV